MLKQVKLEYDDGKFVAYFALDNQTDLLHFKLEVMTQGWLSFGFTTIPDNMNNYDVAIGGVNAAGTGYLKVLVCVCLCVYSYFKKGFPTM